MAPQQYEAIKTDYEYFLQLLILAIAHWEEANIDKETIYH